MSIQIRINPERPFVIAGPCMAESLGLMRSVLSRLVELSQELNFDLIFKASFDKANRTSINSYRGPGLPQALDWFATLKAEYPGLVVLTDVHECCHVEHAAKIIDVLQIPAFLCRQTDLLVTAVQSGRAVNVKKGQFLAPENVQHIITKVHAAAGDQDMPVNYAVTERGTSFGYGNLVVDMRGLKIIKDAGAPVFFDITHSLQLPAAGGTLGEISGGLRKFAPVLARAATATGYLDGFFLEVHEKPSQARSDAATQLSPQQAEVLLRSIIPMWHKIKGISADDLIFA